MNAMKTFLMILLGIDMIAVVGVMLVGTIGIVDIKRSPQTSNRLMRWRVMLQGIAVGLVVLLMLSGS